MGVKRLKTYLVDNSFTRKTNLKDAADTWSASGGNSILLVDTLNIVSHVVDYGEALCCGGEYPAIETRFLEIIKTFEALSIELVFCFDGSVVDERMDAWKERRINRMKSYIDYFDKIDIRKVGAFEEARLFPFLAPSIAKETVRIHCRFINADGDSDLYMAQYINKYKCLGIVSEDTDFVIFDGIPHVFSPEDLVKNICFSKDRNGSPFDPNLLEVTEYCRSQFADSIRLRREAFPIFATLASNDFIEYRDSAEYFKRKFRDTRLQNIASGLADVANDIYRMSDGNVEASSLSLAYEIYERTDYKKVMMDSLKSYDLHNFDTVQPVPSYSTNSKWNRLVEQILKSGPLDPAIKSILLFQKYKQSERFEDDRKPGGIVLAEFRRKMFSILLHEKSGSKEFVEEFVATSPLCFRYKYLVGTVKVGVDHPGLWTLFFGDKEYDETRWKIVWWVMCAPTPADPSGTLVHFDKFRNLINLPDELKLIGMSVFYLYTLIKEITEEEASLLILMAAIVAVYTPHMLKEFSMVNEITKKRAVCVASLYQQTYDYVKAIAVNICRLSFSFKSSKCYSGHLFHWLFKFGRNTSELRNKLPPEVWNKFHLVKAAIKESA